MKIWAVPFFVVVLNGLVLEVVNYLHYANWQTVGILASCKNLRKQLVVYTHLSGCACSPLLVNNTTLAVNFLIFQANKTRPVVKNKKARVYHTFAGNWRIGNVVYGLIVSGSCVKVSPKLNPNFLEVANHILSGEILGAVKGHVLEEVG